MGAGDAGDASTLTPVRSPSPTLAVRVGWGKTNGPARVMQSGWLAQPTLVSRAPKQPAPLSEGSAGHGGTCLGRPDRKTLRCVALVAARPPCRCRGPHAARADSGSAHIYRYG